MSNASNNHFFGGREVPTKLVGKLRDSSALVGDQRKLRGRLAEDGYIFLRNVLDKDKVLAAREEVFARLVEVDEIKQPAMAGIGTGHSRRRELVKDLVAFWRSVSEGPALRQVTHGPRVRAVMKTVFDEPARRKTTFGCVRGRSVGQPDCITITRSSLAAADGSTRSGLRWATFR